MCICACMYYPNMCKCNNFMYVFSFWKIYQRFKPNSWEMEAVEKCFGKFSVKPAKVLHWKQKSHNFFCRIQAIHLYFSGIYIYTHICIYYYHVREGPYFSIRWSRMEEVIRCRCTLVVRFSKARNGPQTFGNLLQRQKSPNFLGQIKANSTYFGQCCAVMMTEFSQIHTKIGQI